MYKFHRAIQFKDFFQFIDWHFEVFSEFLNFESVIPEVLAQKLRRFYCEAKPQNTAKRAEELTLAQSENYHKNSVKSMRSAINRHLQDLGGPIDIVRDKEFKSANNTLDGMLKNYDKNLCFKGH